MSSALVVRHVDAKTQQFQCFLTYIYNIVLFWFLYFLFVRLDVIDKSFLPQPVYSILSASFQRYLLRLYFFFVLMLNLFRFIRCKLNYTILFGINSFVYSIIVKNTISHNGSWLHDHMAKDMEGIKFKKNSPWATRDYEVTIDWNITVDKESFY